MTDVSMTEARKHLGALVRRAVLQRERILVTDHGVPAAVILSSEALADLEDQLALVLHDLDVARSAVRHIPQEEARERLGLPPHSQT
jgi:prevent-host-death family protein